MQLLAIHQRGNSMVTTSPYSKWAKCSHRLQQFIQRAKAKKPLAKVYEQYYRIRAKFLKEPTNDIKRK